MFRWISLGALACLGAGLFGYFLWWLLFSPAPLRIQVVSVGKLAALETPENPFGNSERKAFSALDPRAWRKNVVVYAAEENGNDNTLSAMISPTWLIKEGQRKLAGGGPLRKVAAFYINAVAIQRAGDDDLGLLAQTGQPWRNSSGSAGHEASTGVVSLRSTLENIARSVRPGVWAWVILDLRSPVALADSVNLDTHWESAAQRALQWLRTEHSDLHARLIVTVPCRDNEQNWLAPELRGTFFGHYLKDGLTGGIEPDGKFSGTVSLGRFREQLDARVSNAVAARRFAVQCPVWLPEENVQQASSMPLVSVYRTPRYRAPEPAASAERYADLDGLWEKLEERGPSAWRWDPLNYTVAAGHLVRLEAMAAWADNEVFAAARSLAETGIHSIRPPPPAAGWSLIEDVERDRWLTGQSSGDSAIAGLLASDRADRFLLPFHPEQAEADPDQDPDRYLAAGFRPDYVWAWLVQRARGERGAGFTREQLARCLEFAGIDPATKVELFFIDLLLREVDWDNASAGLSSAIARTIALFHELQSTATLPPHQMAWVLDRSTGIARDGCLSAGMEEAEQEFLLGVDELLVGRVGECGDRLARSAAALEQTRADALRIQGRVDARNRALHVIPQLLVWSIRQRQFVPDSELEGVEDRIRRLATAWLGFASVDPETILLPPDTGLAGEWEAAGASLALLENEFREHVRQLVNADQQDKSNPRTAREIDLVLRTSLLTLRDRKVLHGYTDRFIREGWSSGGQDFVKAAAAGSHPANRSFSSGANIALIVMGSTGTGEFGPAWRGLLNGEPDLWMEGAPLEAAALDPRQYLLRCDLAVRSVAAALAMYPSRHERLLTSAPWTGAWENSLLDWRKFGLLQQLRLARSAWGNADLDRVGSAQAWSVQAAGQVGSQFEGAGPVAAGALGLLDRHWQQERDRCIARLEALRAAFRDSGREIRSSSQTVTDVVEMPKMPSPPEGGGSGIARVELVQSDKRLPLSPTGRPSLPEGWLAVQLEPEGESAAGQRIETTIDLRPWKPADQTPRLRVGWRGNFRTAAVDWKYVERAEISFQTRLERPEGRRSIIAVLPPDDPPPMQIVLLIDCSRSTDSIVNVRREDSGKEESMRLDALLRDTAATFVDRLAAVHEQREAEIHLALMPFGLEQPSAELAPLITAAPTHGGRPNPNPQIWQTGFQELGGQWRNTSKTVIAGLSASGQTPLYSAIMHATRLLDGREGVRLICVLSDGVDEVKSPFRDDERTKNELGSALEAAPGCLVRIFHFDNFQNFRDESLARKKAEWLVSDGNLDAAEKKALEDLRADYEKAEMEGRSALHALEEQFPDRFSVLRQEPGNFRDLIAAFQDTVPTLEVIAEIAGSEGPVRLEGRRIDFRREFEVPPERIPCEVVVRMVGAMYAGTEPRSVSIAGGELVRLAFDRSASRPSLRFPGFAVENGSSYRPGGDTARPDGMRVYWFRPEPDADGRNLRYTLGFDRADGSFCRRPEFIAARIWSGRAGGDQGRVILTPDFAFAPARHYPLAEFSSFRDVPVPAPRARFWWSPTVPPCVRTVTIQAGGNTPRDPGLLDAEIAGFLRECGVDPEQTRVAVRRDGGTIDLDIAYALPPPAADRVIIHCPEFQSVERTTVEEAVRDPGAGQERTVVLKERVTFRLPDASANLPARLWLVTPRVLDQWHQDHPDQLYVLEPDAG